MKNKSSNKHAVLMLFSFIKPFPLQYIFGILLYSSQNFTMAYAMSLLLSWLSNAMLNQSVSEVTTSVIRFGIILLIWMVLLAFGVYCYVICSAKASRDIKKRLFRNYVRDTIEKNINDNSSKGIAAMNTEADLAENILSNSMTAFLGSCISIFFSAIVIFAIDLRLGFLSLIIGLISFLPQYRFAKPIAAIGEKNLAENATALRHVSQSFTGAASIRAYGLEKKQEDVYQQINHRMYLLAVKDAFISMGQNVFTTLQGLLSLAGVFGIGGYLVATGKLSFAALMMVPTLCSSMGEGMSRIGYAYASMQKSVAACKKLAPMLNDNYTAKDIESVKDIEIKKDSDVKKDSDAKKDSKVVKVNSENREFLLNKKQQLATNTDASHTKSNEYSKNGQINIKNLVFSYLSASQPTLLNITINIPANKMTAIVGQSGSGKSTLLRVIMGMYERSELPIKLGNISYAQTKLNTWRKYFAYVDQSCKLFDMSIAENIRLGMQGSSDKEVKNAAIAAGADGFIKNLSNGYQSSCGEGGAFLSGGQKQRIAIARALIRKAPVLVFDEAASALDSDSEELVMSSIRNLRGTHTILITTHNLSEIKDADHIIVMKDGKVAESGTHNELLANNGEYVKLLHHTTNVI